MGQRDEVQRWLLQAIMYAFSEWQMQSQQLEFNYMRAHILWMAGWLVV
jgi:hypothetical protein